jgi:hypothetical protein
MLSRCRILHPHSRKQASIEAKQGLSRATLFREAGGPPLNNVCLRHFKLKGAPSLRFWQGWAAMLPTRRMLVPLCEHLSSPVRKVREGRGTLCGGGADEIKSLGPPARSFRHYLTGEAGLVEIESRWTARTRQQKGIFPTVKICSSAENPRPSGAWTGHPRE